MSTSGPTQKAVVLDILAAIGTIGDVNQTPMNFSLSGQTAAYPLSAVVVVEPGATAQEVTMTSLFNFPNGAVAWGIQEVSSNPTEAWTGVIAYGPTVGTATDITLAVGGVIVGTGNPAGISNGLADLVFSNTDPNNAAYLNVWAIGS